MTKVLFLFKSSRQNTNVLKSLGTKMSKTPNVYTKIGFNIHIGEVNLLINLKFNFILLSFEILIKQLH